MPSHDYLAHRRRADRFWIEDKRTLARVLAALMRKRRDRRPGESGEAVPVEPNRPNTLSGGAAAALEFDG